LAKKLQVSEEELKSVIDTYWSLIRKTLSSIEHNHVFMPGLGTFKVKPWALDKKMKANEAIIRKYTETPTSFSLDVINKLSQDNLKIQAMKERVESEKAKKTEIKNERRKQNLEGEKQDS
jgi:nucleoid DNA-binding protein